MSTAFTKAIVRQPGKSMTNGLTTTTSGKPDYRLAVTQHAAYVTVLEEIGLDVTVLPPEEDYPDSTFVEDVALLTPRCAVITRPGAVSRRGETAGIEEIITRHFSTIEKIVAPGTLDAGDVMMVGDHSYIGLSERTDSHGATQLIEILKLHGMTGSTVQLNDVLHLKSGVSYLENNSLVVAGKFTDCPDFDRFNPIIIDQPEAYAANCLWLNGTVLVASGFPKTLRAIKKAGYRTIALDMSEFQKLDGGLSCLSLRF